MTWRHCFRRVGEEERGPSTHFRALSFILLATMGARKVDYMNVCKGRREKKRGEKKRGERKRGK